MTHPPAEKNLQADDPGDLLAIIAHTFGYTPTDSLVIIGLQDGHTEAFLRVDLTPAMTNPHKLAADYCPLFQEAHDAVMVAIMTDQAPAPSQQDNKAPEIVLGEVIMEAMAGVGVPVAAAWQIGAGYAHPLDCTDADCCPYPGVPAVILSEAGEELMPETEVTPIEEVEAFGHGQPTPGFATEASTAETSTEDGLQVWDAILSGQVNSHMLTSKEMAAVTQLLAGNGPKALIATAAADLATGYRETFQAGSPIPTVADGTGPAPDWRRIDRLATALNDVIPYATKEGKAGAYAIMSWLNWAKGKGTVHLLFTDRALAQDPTNELARVLAAQDENPCGWQQHKSTAYKPGT